jgi:hypothetical protein
MTAPAALQHALRPNALGAARRTAGLTLVQAGAAIGKHWMTISKYERGLIDPPASVLVAFAALYGVHPGEFFTPQT